MANAQSRLTQLPADKPSFRLQIPGVSEDQLLVRCFKSQAWHISSHYSWDIDCLAAPNLDLTSLSTKTAQLAIAWPPDTVWLGGIIQACINQGTTPDNQWQLCQFKLVSPLEPLAKSQHTRRFVNSSVVDIVKQVLETASWPSQQVQWQLTRDYPARPFTLQWNESDLAFMERLLFEAGINYVLQTDANQTTLVLFDDSRQLARFADNGLPGVTEAGMVTTNEQIWNFNKNVALLSKSVSLRSYPFNQPDSSLLATASSQLSQVPSRGEIQRHASDFATQEQGNLLAEAWIQAIDAERLVYTFQSNARGLQPGQRFALTSHPWEPNYAGADYTVTQIDCQGDQSGWLASEYAISPTILSIHSNTEQLPATYQIHAKAISAKQTFRHRPRSSPHFNHILPAIIVGDETSPHLDADGRYQVRFPFETESLDTPLALLQPYGGPTSDGKAQGMHFPLRPNTQVGVIFLDHTLNQPVIAGVIHYPDQPSTVTINNSDQHVLRTAAGHELVLDDDPQQPGLKLATPRGTNTIEMSNSNGRPTTSVTTQGNLQLQSANAMKTETGGSQTTTVGNNHAVTVSGNKTLLSAAGNIRQQAGQDQVMTAQSLAFDTGQTSQFEAGRHLQIQAGQHLNWHSRQGDIHLQAPQSSIQVISQKDLSVQASQGPLYVGQPKGGFYATADGQLHYFGPKLSIQAEEIHHNGPVNYNTSSPPQAPAMNPAQQTANTQSLLFLQELEELAGSEATVNQLHPKPLPLGDVYEYPLKPGQSQGAVCLKHSKGELRWLDNLSQFPPDENGQRRFYAGPFPNIAEKKAGASGSSSENSSGTASTESNKQIAKPDFDIKLPMVVILPTAGIFTTALIAEGKYNLAWIGPEMLHWLMQVIGQVNPHAAGLATDIGEFFLNENKWRLFLTQIIHRDEFYIKHVSPKGDKAITDEFHVIFRGNSRARSFLAGTRYLPENPKLTLITSFIDGKALGKIAGISSALKEGVLGLAVIGIVDCIQYYLNPDQHKVFTDLLVKLVVDELEAAAGIVVAYLLGTIAMLFVGTTLMVTVIAATAGIFVAYYVSHKLDQTDEHYHVSEKIKEWVREGKVGEYINNGKFIEYMTHTSVKVVQMIENLHKTSPNGFVELGEI